MLATVIAVENVSKRYQLGSISTGTFYGDLKRWWAKQRGWPDPFQKVGEINYNNRQSDTLWALKNISFEVEQGQAVGIIGRNGAGKSTLLKILSRVTAPTSGVIRAKGRIAALLEVGTGFHPELTGRENIFLNGAILGMKEDEIKHKFDEIVDFSGIEQFIDTPVKRYSSGMYVRLAFAVAAHLDPEILILDEVLAVGDAQFQKKCLNKVRDVTKVGRTVLFVSHNLTAIQSLCDYAILLDKGTIAYTGNVGGTIEAYLGTDQLHSGEAIIPETYPRLGHGQARLRKIELANSEGELISHLYFGQSFKIILNIEVNNWVQDEIMSFIYVSAADGTRFGVTYNVENSKAGWQLEEGIYRVMIDINAVFLPYHTYYFDIGLYNRAGTEVYDFVERILQFNVLSASKTGTDSYPGTQSHAYFRIESNWQRPVRLVKNL